MFLILLLLFTLVPLTEFYLMVKISGIIGFWTTVGTILLTGVVGAALAKSEGQIILIKLQQEMAEGKMPQQSILNGFLVFAGGLLLLTPGFLTDLLGLSMVLPFTRFFLVRVAEQVLKRMIKSGNVNYHVYHQQPPSNTNSSGARMSDPTVIDIEAEIIETDTIKKD